MTTAPSPSGWFRRKAWTQALPEVLTFALCLLMLRLGAWQHHKAEVKTERQSLYVQYAREPLCHGAACLPQPGETPAYGRRVQLDGLQWSPRHCLLDNQVIAGRAGYLAMTSLTAPAVVVLRGWLPMSSRTEAPRLGAAPLPETLTAEIAYPPATGVTLGLRPVAPEPFGADILRIQYLDRDSLRLCFGVDALAYVLRETTPSGDGLTRAWSAPGSGAERHQAYAVQWWAMTAVLVIAYGFFRRSTTGPKHHDRPQ